MGPTPEPTEALLLGAYVSISVIKRRGAIILGIPKCYDLVKMKIKDILAAVYVPAALIVICGVFTLTVGITYLYSNEVEVAEVVGYSEDVDNGETYYGLVIKTISGEVLKSEIYTFSKKYPIGGKINIIFRSKNEFVIDPSGVYFFVAGICISLGIISSILIYAIRTKIK